MYKYRLVSKSEVREILKSDEEKAAILNDVVEAFQKVCSEFPEIKGTKISFYTECANNDIVHSDYESEVEVYGVYSAAKGIRIVIDNTREEQIFAVLHEAYHAKQRQYYGSAYVEKKYRDVIEEQANNYAEEKIQEWYGLDFNPHKKTNNNGWHPIMIGTGILAMEGLRKGNYVVYSDYRGNNYEGWLYWSNVYGWQLV